MKLRPKPYPEYKDSGVEWLGQTPSNWDIKPGLFAFSKKKVKNTGMVENTVLSLSYGRIVIKPPEKLHGLVPESFETYQIVNPGDIIIRSTDLQNDWNSLRVGLVENRGIITSAYICLNTNERMIPPYVHLLLHSYDLMKIFYGMGSGLRQNLDWSDFKRLPILIPSIKEQQNIVGFIRTKTREINLFIRSKRRMIELLKEQKQVIINNAVTKGINPDVKLKSSGVDWLGDIPEHWELRQLRFTASGFTNGTTATQLFEGVSEYPVSRIESISSGEINYEKVGYIKEEDCREHYWLKQNDFLISHINSYEIVGNSAMYDGIKPLIHGMNLIRISPLPCVNPLYLKYYFRSELFRGQMKRCCKPAINQVSVTTTAIKAIKIFYPPKEEQDALVGYCETECANIDIVIKKTEREIELIREYRTRLISDVVTGKVDVRDIPVEPVEDIEEVEELEGIQEREELTELQEVTDADD